jgi:hypothetical protein
VKVDVVLSGDPNRKELFEAISQIYSKYATVTNVLLYFEKNPAKAFNRASRESDADVLFCTGDIYLREKDMSSMVNQLHSGGGDVVFIVPPRLRGKETILFVDAGFTVKKETLLNNPMPEEPDFMEEVLWYNSKKNVLKFQPYFGTHYHLHRHKFNHILRLLRQRYGERAKAKKRGKVVRTLATVKIFLESIREYIAERLLPSPEEELRRLRNSG